MSGGRIENEWRSELFQKKSAVTEYMKELVQRALSRRCNDILDDQEICKCKTHKQRGVRIAIGTRHYGEKNDLATFDFGVDLR
jgi:hypothetical protein